MTHPGVASSRFPQYGVAGKVALVGVTVSWVLTIAAFVLLGVTTAAGVRGNLFHYQDAAVGAIYPALGWLLLRRLGSHPVGWILMAAGLSGALGAFSEEYVTVGFELYPGSLPVVTEVAWVGAWTWSFFYALLPLLLLVFPDGTVPSRRWTPFLWLARLPVVALPGVLAVATWGVPISVLASSEDPNFPAAMEVLFLSSGAVLVLALLAAIVSLAVRWRSSSGLARQQMRVFAQCAVAGVVTLGLSQWQIPGHEVLGVVAFVSVPVGMVAAILRYRLYDIDRLVSRTVAYAVLTVALLAVFFVSVFVLQLLIPAQSDLATAASTLAAAAAFAPLRQRIQTFIDARFNRSRYDAQKTVERFGRMLRSRTGMNEVSVDLASSVAAALEPTHLSIWLSDRSEQRT